jgi:DNA-binding HxlR family transcriptional regulator
MDGILWFPFNLIAKESNYDNALNAANQRILAMRQLKTEKKCSDQLPAVQQVAQQDLTKRIRELNQLYKDGILTEDEYKTQKEKVLNAM